MKNHRFTIACTLAGVLVPALALAATPADGEHHSMFNMGFWYHVINFAILAGALYMLLRKPMREFLTNRRANTEKAIAEATAAKKKAEEALAVYKDKMAGLETELAGLKSEIMSAGERERDALIAAARTQAEKIIADARLVGEQEVRRAREALRAEVVALASKLAEQKLAAAATADKDKQFSEFLSKLEALS